MRFYEVSGERTANLNRSEEAAMTVTATFLWYLVISGPQGGLVALPSPFDSNEQCQGAIAEFGKTNPSSNWTLQCVPAGAPLSEEIIEDAPSDGDPQ
jgi:hypothetical protein